jgi:hypothetical protein
VAPLAVQALVQWTQHTALHESMSEGHVFIAVKRGSVSHAQCNVIVACDNGSHVSICLRALQIEYSLPAFSGVRVVATMSVVE